MVGALCDEMIINLSTMAAGTRGSHSKALLGAGVLSVAIYTFFDRTKNLKKWKYLSILTALPTALKFGIEHTTIPANRTPRDKMSHEGGRFSKLNPMRFFR